VKKYIGVCVAVMLLSGCSDPPFLEVDGKVISESEFQQYLNLKRIPSSSEKQVQRALEDYASREALAAAILKDDKIENASVNAEVEEFRKQLVIGRYFDHYLADVVNESAVANFYNANAQDYQTRKAKLSHVLVRTRPEMSDEERAAALTKITEVLSRARRGDEFTTLAKEFSEDAVSAGKGGDLGWLQEGAVSESFSAAAFSLDVGEISDVVTTPFGFHVIRLEEGPEVVRQPLESVEGNIRYHLRQKAKEEETKRLLESIEVSVSEKAKS